MGKVSAVLARKYNRRTQIFDQLLAGLLRLNWEHATTFEAAYDEFQSIERGQLQVGMSGGKKFAPISAVFSFCCSQPGSGPSAFSKFVFIMLTL